MGKLLGIATRAKSKAPMDALEKTVISFQAGVGSDSRGTIQGKRQVTVHTQEAWNASCDELQQAMPWTTRRANLFISGIDLENSTGKRLRIGDCELEITGELEPCARMDAQFEGLTNALKNNWRGGVCCRILSEGAVAIGDEIEILA